MDYKNSTKLRCKIHGGKNLIQKRTPVHDSIQNERNTDIRLLFNLLRILFMINDEFK